MYVIVPSSSARRTNRRSAWPHAVAANGVVVWSTSSVFVLFGLALLVLEVLFFKALVECCPRGLADHAGPVELVRDHCPADAVRLRELYDLYGDGRKTQFQNRRELPYLTSREEEFSCNIVAVPLDLILAIQPANPGLSQPQVREFMHGGERPCRPGVLIVDYDEWRDIVGKSESAECFHGDVRVMAAEVAQEEDVDAAGLDRSLEVRECLISDPSGAIRGQAEGEPFRHARRKPGSGEFDGCGTDELRREIHRSFTVAARQGY